ncbi:hypothetical protein E4U10_000188, partial [Claviceps purpurea]
MTIYKSQGMTLDLAIVDLKARGTPRSLGLLYVVLSRVRRLEHLAIFADIILDDIRPNVTRALEVRRLDEENRAQQVLLPPLGPPMPRTPDLLTPRPLTFSTGASTGRRERERDREGTPTPRAIPNFQQSVKKDLNPVPASPPRPRRHHIYR